MDHVGGHVDPLRVITRIPKGMEIWNLRKRLCHIIADYRTQTSLQEGCNNILKADCVQLNARLFREVRRCVRSVYLTDGTDSQSSSWTHYNAVTGISTPSTEPTLEPTKRRNVRREGRGTAEELLEERLPMWTGFLVEDDSTNMDYTESMRFKIPRAQTVDDSREALPSLIQ